MYGLSLVAMLTAALCFCHTFSVEHARLSLANSLATALENTSEPALSLSEQPLASDMNAPTLTLLETTSAWLESHTIQVGWAWGFCVLLLWFRLLGGWWLVQRLRHRDVALPGAVWQEQCRMLSKKLEINTLVRLLESPHVHEPLTLGFWKPVILFPTGMLLSLSPAQVEALLLHELAHIRRYDYLVNLFQLTLETCFFYHPLFWLISREARVRREFCCDDVVLYHTSNPILYAKTLTDLQLSFHQPSTHFTMNATGKSRFTERILRIAGVSPKRENRPNWLIIMLLPALIAISSWWPTQAAPMPNNATMDVSAINLTDSLPPRQSATPTPQPNKAKPAQQNPTPAPEAPGKTKDYAIEVVKMNVLYIGVDNPVRISVNGVPSGELVVHLEGQGTIEGGNGNYNVQVTQPGEVTISVFRRTSEGEMKISSQKYRVKRIPDPTPMLEGLYRSSTVTKEKFLGAKTVLAVLENFDFDAVCEVVGFQLTIVPKKQDPVYFDVGGSKIPVKALEMIKSLSGDGDAIFFDEIQVKCPGDQNSRHIGGVAYKLKLAE
jgi:beta-lactamase regulating signal transducer with metallopeptidase domain